MAEIVHWIMESIRVYGPWSVFVGIIIESVIVPIPSPLVVMGAGFILISPQMSADEALVPVLLLIVLPGSVASTLGAYVGYGIGYFGGKPLLERWKGFLGFGWQEVEAMERHFRARGINASIFFLRALPIFPLSVISAGAGLLRLPVRQFTLWTFYGSLLRCFFLGYLGWWTGDAYHQIASGIDRAEALVSVLIVTSALAIVLWLRAKVRGKILKRGTAD
ncbi:MAG TPA: VTT domain-containing protein [Candidatus Binatia bacterium]|nr:VTT domain-containing protein [Candidatus Binatia bacterium]